MPLLRRREPELVEEMDRVDCDPEALDRTYAAFRFVNGAVAGWRRTYREHLRPALRLAEVAGSPATLLDLGCGGGDLSLALARWSARDGIHVEVTGIDPDPRAHAFAQHRPSPTGVSFEAASSGDLVAAGRTFDVVVTNHVLHHLDSDAFADVLADCGRLAERLVVHSDLRRSALAYGLFWVATLGVRRSLIRIDGLRSIRRSYRTDELTKLVPGGWRVLAPPPFRILLVRSLGRDDQRTPRPSGALDERGDAS